ncbi:MAG: hypothetical protein HY961_10175, partial [Ignavibacteriae bacterium]|nr:hypothetical protein [Ignavibacteriota bacterium]
MQRYSNVIQALVYAGAAFLVIIVGLRGLGDLSEVKFIPSWFLEEATGRISVNIVMAGLVAEFAMLFALAFLIYKTPRLNTEMMAVAKTGTPAIITSTGDVERLVDAERQLIESLGRKIEVLIESERRVIEQIGNKYNDVAEAQRQILDVLAKRLDENQSTND